jgi:serine/threonine-protein kinase
MPWPGTETTGRAALQHDTNKPVDILTLRPKMNKTLAGAIMSCLESNPDNRPPSAEEFLDTIRRVQSIDR